MLESTALNTEELKQLGLDGLRALIFVLAKIYQSLH